MFLHMEKKAVLATPVLVKDVFKNILCDNLVLQYFHVNKLERKCKGVIYLLVFCNKNHCMSFP